jgi:rhodanese-related sulfurtransferase
MTSSANSHSIKDALQDPNCLVVDVRSSEEHKAGPNYPESKSIPISEFQQRVLELGEDLSRPVILHCRAGARAAKCAEIAKNHGYTNIFVASNAEELNNIAKS